MNMHKFYQFKANESLNASLVALIPAITLVIIMTLFIQNSRILVFVIPFMIYSFVCYQEYLKNKDRTHEVVIHSRLRENSEILLRNISAIQFFPSPSLRLLFFSEEGFLTGELLDANTRKIRWFFPYTLDSLLAKRYQLIDSNHQLHASYQQLNRKQWQVSDAEGKKIAKVSQLENDLFEFESQLSLKKVKLVSSRVFTDIKLLDEEGFEILRIRKGWLPTKWEEFFKDPNTPIITFAPHLTPCDRVILLTMVIQALRYRNH